MGIDLKYNLDDYSKATMDIANLKVNIESSRDTMINNLSLIRKDWTLDGGLAFFDSVDTDWVDSVQVCIDVLDDLSSALEEGNKEYSKIQEEAKKNLVI